MYRNATLIVEFKGGANHVTRVIAPAGIDFDSPETEFDLHFAWSDRFQKWYVTPINLAGELMAAPIFATPGAYFCWSDISAPYRLTHKLMFLGNRWDNPVMNSEDLQLAFVAV